MSEQIVKYSITDAMISEWREQFLKLEIKGIDDKDGFRAVNAARLKVKRHRCDVEKARKERKAEVLEYGRKVDSEARRITEQLEPIETYLESEESRINDEKNRIAAEKEALEQEKIARRVHLLWQYETRITDHEARNWTEDEFNACLGAACMEYEERKAAEAAELERVRLDKEAEAVQREQVRIEQQRERERIADERRVIEEERRAMAAEKARIAANEKAKEILIVAEECGETIKAFQDPEETKAKIEGVRDAFAQEIIGEVVHASARFYIHPSGGSIALVGSIEKLHDAIGQWIDETGIYGDEIKIKLVMMLDSEYDDIMAAGGM